MNGARLPAAVRTPCGRFGGVLPGVRSDDLAATAPTGLPGKAPDPHRSAAGDVVRGDFEGAGEENGDDSGDDGRAAALPAGLPVSVPAATAGRLCGSGRDAAVTASRIPGAGRALAVVRESATTEEGPR
ncbi:hypothetical protein [Streptomyces genisteinicus]|uniref:Thiolase N-terminal domain-containing protein n=1 Tax=Streptomyces genisteinicus TaxID=2768068 RepID=A0A7H0HYY7_9ACTN|nr:hypothetical protein [Streptomyces genisteinicus]QNP65753.1 hypothetical protein IAG43_24340 [Streptomyces genisteinicus]